MESCYLFVGEFVIDAAPHVRRLVDGPSLAWRPGVSMKILTQSHRTAPVAAKFAFTLRSPYVQRGCRITVARSYRAARHPCRMHGVVPEEQRRQPCQGARHAVPHVPDPHHGDREDGDVEGHEGGQGEEPHPASVTARQGVACPSEHAAMEKVEAGPGGSLPKLGDLEQHLGDGPSGLGEGKVQPGAICEDRQREDQ